MDDFRRLVVLANEGDTDAGERLIVAWLPYWMGAARQIIGTDSRAFRVGGQHEDAEDLVQAAVTKLLDLWKRGIGPTDNVRAYVTVMMRNSYSNRLRSPRSREFPLDTVNEEVFAEFDSGLEAAELTRERNAVQRALAALPRDHRDILIWVVVSGHKPGELTGSLGREAPAISSLLMRAKQSLRRFVLVDYLTDGGEECAQNAEQLPKRIHIDLQAHDKDERGIAHARNCERCRRNWRRFAATASMFGIIPLVALPSFNQGAAAYASPPEELARPDAAARPETRSASNSVVSRVAAIASSRGVLVSGVVLVLIVPLLLFVPTLVEAGAVNRQTTRADLTSENTHGAKLAVDLNLDTTGRLESFTTNLIVEGSVSWSLGRIEVELSPGTGYVSASNGYNCTTTGAWVTCDPTTESQSETAVTIYTENDGASGSFDLRLASTIGGDTVLGVADGHW
ncbi:sigma-70 family RNA polymerase sigma factor [Leucobacter viscericola]|uniref:Sigma-70 family RNA polymerase sigma factor n=1 Tax=Leucobacter viscericola TaxID=2714935 RepID=A0A6G7XEU2_9MICO|nr:sigma-70 family RNA polymerase sigma factor [Leucobacter viscericola]QIK62917.1 sigma-70 family RNA polymerase sigma factor [Leucobacter viscericola]